MEWNSVSSVFSLHHSFAAKPCMITRVKITTFSWNLRKIWLLLFLRKIEIINLHINFDYTGIFYQGLLLLFAPQCGSVQVNFLFKYPLAFFDIGDGKMCPIFVGWTLRNSSQLFFSQIICKSERNEAFCLHQFPTKNFTTFC